MNVITAIMGDLYGIIRATFLGIRNQSLSQRGKYYHATVDQEQCTWNSAGKTTMERLEQIKEQSLALELERLLLSNIS